MLRSFFLHLYLMRVPLLMLGILGLLLPWALNSSMFHGLADLETNQVALVTFAAFLLLSASETCCFLVLLYGSQRADGKREAIPEPEDPRAMPTHMRRAGVGVLILYIAGGLLFLNFLCHVEQTMVAAHLNKNGLALRFWINASIGTLVGVVWVFFVSLVDLYLSDRRSEAEVEVFALPFLYLFREVRWFSDLWQSISDRRPLQAVRLEPYFVRDNEFSRLLVRLLGPGYGRFDNDGNPLKLYAGHRFALLLSLVCFFIYLASGMGVHGRLVDEGAFPPPQPYDAVLLQAILLLLLACWALAGLSFYFDRFRVPVLIPILAFSIFTSYPKNTDHLYSAIHLSGPPKLATPAAKFAKKNDRVIVVAAAGGGIQAAAWTSEVLCGLRRDLGLSFDDSVLAISGVSGGSVGTMFYLRCLESPPGDMGGATAAKNSSLEAIAWGLAHPDLRRAIFPFAAQLWPEVDRGWALERALRKNAQFSPEDRPLASSELQRKWPTILLNSTEVRTGDPMVFTNSDFPAPVDAPEKNHSLHGFHKEYPGNDVALESAVRMSAAFPYVSLAAHLDSMPNAEHLVDGGYFNNSGFFTLAKWLLEALPDPPASAKPGPLVTSRKKILVLIIDAFPDTDWKGPADSPQGWLYQAVAPVDTVLRVRSEGQIVRDLFESSNLLQFLSSRGYQAEALTARYIPPKITSRSTGSAVCPPDPPLTWRLTEVEKACIDQRWDDVKQGLTLEINTFFASGPAPVSQAPKQVVTRPLAGGAILQELR